MGADGSGGKYPNIPSSGVAILPTDEARAKHETYIAMDGEVYKFAVKVMGTDGGKPWAGLSYEVDLMVPHQANNTRIIDIQSAAKRLPPSHGKSLCHR